MGLVLVAPAGRRPIPKANRSRTSCGIPIVIPGFVATEVVARVAGVIVLVAAAAVAVVEVRHALPWISFFKLAVNIYMLGYV